MELLQLKYLCTAARLENFSRAAKHHSIPQSAISKTIAQLERELGVQLFLRNGNRVTLSDSGKKFCREVETALGILNDAAAHIRVNGSPLHGEIRLLVEEHTSEVFRAVSEFRREYPNVSFSLQTQSRGAGGFDYDLRISATSRLGDKLAAHPLLDAEVLLLVPATHGLTKWNSVPTEALREEGQIILSREAPAFSAAADLLSRAGLSLPVVLECADPRALLEFVGAGTGIAFAAGISKRDAAAAGVALLRLQDANIRYGTALSFRRTLSPAAEAFCESLLTRLGKK